MMDAALYARLRRRFYVERIGTSSAERGVPQHAFRDALGTDRFVRARARVSPTVEVRDRRVRRRPGRRIRSTGDFMDLRQLRLLPDDNDN
jgi:hypothetical protein